MAEVFRHDREAGTYAVTIDGTPAGVADYELTDGVADFDHTEVSPAYNGRGLGTTLVKGALDQVRAAGTWKVRATCPFVVTFLKRHPEYDDLVVP